MKLADFNLTSRYLSDLDFILPPPFFRTLIAVTCNYLVSTIEFRANLVLCNNHINIIIFLKL